jgi:hypothetical protein
LTDKSLTQGGLNHCCQGKVVCADYENDRYLAKASLIFLGTVSSHQHEEFCQPIST